MTVGELVGSLLLFYLPTSALSTYESLSGERLRDRTALPSVAADVCLVLGTVVNAFAFGLKNKVYLNHRNKSQFRLFNVLGTAFRESLLKIA